MTQIFRNGKYITINSNNVSIINGQVFVDGKPVNEFDSDKEEKVVNITINGNVERLEVDVCETIKITGDCKRVHTHNGSIEIGGNVSGDVHTNMGSITCGDVSGDVHTNMGSIYTSTDKL